ncbi:hypothetical protein ACJX0J_039180, partial [Zea mays]
MKFEFSHIFFPYQIAFMWDFRIWISGLLLCLETTLETWSIIINAVQILEIEISSCQSLRSECASLWSSINGDLKVEDQYFGWSVRPSDQGLIGGLHIIFQMDVAIAVEDKGQVHQNAKRIVFYTQVDVTPEGNPVLMGTFLVAHHPAKVLFDTGASHTFISRTFAVNYDVPIQETHMGVIVKSPGGNIEGTGHRSDS